MNESFTHQPPPLTDYNTGGCSFGIAQVNVRSTPITLSDLTWCMATEKDKKIEDVRVIKQQPQGGKSFGKLELEQEAALDKICQQYLQSNSDAKEEEVVKYKKKFMLYDLDRSGDINMEELKLMMEKLGQPKTHLELKKMIGQVDRTGRGAITFMDFLDMMLGKTNSILKKILQFEELAKKPEKPKGIAPKRALTDLP